MKARGKVLKPAVFLCVFLMCFSAFAQDDSLSNAAQKKDNLLEKVINSFRKDSTEAEDINELHRLDEKFKAFEGLTIRDIVVHRFPFGIPLGDTTKKLINSLTKAANKIHHLTKERVIERNLFFKKNEKIKPLLLADNEQYLRQLPFFQDAEILVIPTRPGGDTADIIVLTKDIFSLGGAIGSLGINKTQIEAREDNFAGSGNSAVLYALYDKDRNPNFSLGGEYVGRNIGGSFVNSKIGYQNYYTTRPGPREENYYYLNLSKPLINRFMNWTYELNAAKHATKNHYSKDSLYYSDYRYNFTDLELWAGVNLRAKDYTPHEEEHKLRKILGARVVNRNFSKKPIKYDNQYNWRYADIFGVLGTFRLYRQNFYKTKYIYGFGRTEDIPEGLLMEFTTGYTLKEDRSRPFLGFNYERYYFNKNNNYLEYIIRSEGYLNKNKLEDINLLVAVSYFDHLKSIGDKWKQRFFLNLDAAQQINTVLNEPLYIKSKFGLPEYGNNEVGGTLRSTVKAESVFFSPWQLVAFKFAPFVFTNLSVFSPYSHPLKVYSSIGGGFRTRNESLIFGTIELKGYYFPQKNFYKESFRFEISTNIIFKYNSGFLKKPDFIEIN